MRVLVISDIHANLEAFRAVLDAAGDWDALWCLGDVVGYGPQPNECVALLAEQPNALCLVGNHDAAAVGELSLDSFNPEARASIEWQRDALDAASIEFLQGREAFQVRPEATLAHASPRQPILEYVLDTRAAHENFDYFDGPFCFVGHTHIPAHFYLNGQDPAPQMHVPDADEQLQLRARCIVNPGSVGQPRDRDPRAAFAFFDTEAHTWDCHRVAYDVAKVQDQMRAHKLPTRHVQRLATGW